MVDISSLEEEFTGKTYDEDVHEVIKRIYAMQVGVVDVKVRHVDTDVVMGLTADFRTNRLSIMTKNNIITGMQLG